MPFVSVQPQDLNPNAPRRVEARSRRPPAYLQRPTSQDVRAHGDYKNVDFLKRFVSDAGRLLPRRYTRLPGPQHRCVAIFHIPSYFLLCCCVCVHFCRRACLIFGW